MNGVTLRDLHHYLEVLMQEYPEAGSIFAEGWDVTYIRRPESDFVSVHLAARGADDRHRMPLFCDKLATNGDYASGSRLNRDTLPGQVSYESLMYYRGQVDS